MSKATSNNKPSDGYWRGSVGDEISNFTLPLVEDEVKVPFPSIHWRPPANLFSMNSGLHRGGAYCRVVLGSLHAESHISWVCFNSEHLVNARKQFGAVEA
ncbi:unnamed protein product, partial [Clonostachys chloroleuca]